MVSALVSNFVNPLSSFNSGKRLLPRRKLLSPLHLFSSLQVVAETDSVSKHLVWPSPDDDVPFWKRDFPSWDATSEVPIDIVKDSNPMHIIHVTAEMAPIAKVGGLGDVVTGLARACLLRGHTVDIMLPFYECIQRNQISDLVLVTTYNSYHDGNWIQTNAYRGAVSGIPVIFIEPSNEFFKGKQVYGGSYNELEAYLFFSRASLEWMQVPHSYKNSPYFYRATTCIV